MIIRKTRDIAGRADARSVNSSRNALAFIVVAGVTAIFSFINRTVFIFCLGSEYLGLGGLFSNLLSFLSLAELGIGSALNYALYAPLADGDIRKVAALMRTYKRLYALIGITVLVGGLALTPLLPHLMSDVPAGIPMDLVNLYYALYVLSSALTYFFAYKRALIVCDQREYLVTLADGLFRVLAACLQIALLLAMHSFLAYLVASIACTLLGNVFVARMANRLYPFLRQNPSCELDAGERRALRSNAGAIFLHKVGGIVVFASDNVIISKFIGLVEVGLYSNYTMILSAINAIATKVMQSMTASVGNMMAEGDDERTESVFYHVLFLNAWLYGFTSTCLLCLLQPFIALWIGQDYLLPWGAVVLAVFNHYANGMRMTLLIFKDAAGIFRQDRFKPLVEAAVNIALSIPLAQAYGITGVLAGTAISTLGVAFWFEAYTFFKVRYRKGPFRYFAAQLGYLAFNAALAGAIIEACSLIGVPGIGGFALSLLVCLLAYNAVFCAVFWRQGHFAYFRSFAKTTFSRKA